MEKDRLLAALREKLDVGYESYMQDMISRGAEIVFENSEEILYNQQIYDAMYSDDLLSTEQLELFLQFKDPLLVLRNQWAFWNEAVLRDEIDTSREMADAMQGFYDNYDTIHEGTYEMENQDTPAEPEQGQQMT